MVTSLVPGTLNPNPKTLEQWAPDFCRLMCMHWLREHIEAEEEGARAMTAPLLRQDPRNRYISAEAGIFQLKSVKNTPQDFIICAQLSHTHG